MASYRHLDTEGWWGQNRACVFVKILTPSGGYNSAYMYMLRLTPIGLVKLESLVNCEKGDKSVYLIQIPICNKWKKANSLSHSNNHKHLC